MNALQNALDEYADRFDNLADVMHPSFAGDEKFAPLLESAIKSGQALTREDVEKVFGPQGWDW